MEGAALQKEDWVLEIGPGLGGALTALMAPVCGQVLAVEIDSELVEILHSLKGSLSGGPLGGSPVKIIKGDALALNWRESLQQAGGWEGGQPLKMVANLPYYLTSPP